MNQQPFWENCYRESGAPDTFGNGKPSEFLVEAIENHFSGATVLDLGCGEGRNALYAAVLGFDVTAFDISAAGIEKLKSLAGDQGLQINAFVCDMKDFEFRESYDLIISTGCLHLLERHQWQVVLPNILENTSPDGLNVIDIFTDKLPPPEDLAPFVKGLFREGELFEYYNRWEIIKQDSRVFEDQHKGGTRHTHASNRIIARKPV
jgi:tellurite methyltransferase